MKNYKNYNSSLKLQVNEAKRCSYPLRLDVYGSGCDHNCSYCYARSQMIVGGWNNKNLHVIWYYGLNTEIKDGSFKGTEVGDYLISKTNINIAKYLSHSIINSSSLPKFEILLPVDSATFKYSCTEGFNAQVIKDAEAGKRKIPLNKTS